MNTLYNSNDTIAALATPLGVGGIAVIRISGRNAFSIVDSIFRSPVNIANVKTHTIHYGSIVDKSSQSVIDTVLVSIFRNPHSYTGEDVAEISVHGGHFVSQKILSLLYVSGARAAQPGEFTFRAFQNGKLDLTQAEAVADIIHSRTEKSHRASVEQLNGKLSQYINDLRTQLLNLCSLIELELDFSQEGIELAEVEESIQRVKGIEAKIKIMIDSYESGKLAREGVKVALAGRPNAGKSSLLNLLLGEERAIVSEIPGTTRDVIEESIVLEGLEFVFIDTAGLRESIDVIEREGIRRTIQNLQKADVAIFVVDGSAPLNGEDIQLYNEIVNTLRSNVHTLFVINKNDIRHPELSLSQLPGKNIVEISCKDNYGLDKLKRELVNTALPQYDSLSSSIMITNLRHKDALVHSLQSLESARHSMSNGMSGDFVAVDLRDALNYLGEIIGITTPDDILNNIFSHFCIGK